MSKNKNPIRGKNWRIGITKAFLCSDLTDSEKVIYAMIWCHADRNTKIAYPSMDKIAVETNHTTKTVCKAIQSLEEKGYLTIIRGTGYKKGRKPVNVYQCNIDPGNYLDDDIETLKDIAKENSINRAIELLAAFSADLTDEQRKKALESITGNNALKSPEIYLTEE